MMDISSLCIFQNPLDFIAQNKLCCIQILKNHLGDQGFLGCKKNVIVLQMNEIRSVKEEEGKDAD